MGLTSPGPKSCPYLGETVRTDGRTDKFPYTQMGDNMLVAVLNQKGGVGKTTIATNLGAAAQLDGKRTLILDLDSQGSALDWYAARKEGSKLADLATVKVDRALSAPQFQQISAGYEFVVFDGPPRLNEIARSAAIVADVVLIPVQPGPYDLWAASDTLGILDQADSTRADLGRPKVRRLFVINRATSGTVLAREAPEVLGQHAEVASVVLHQRIVFAEAAATGESVLTVDPSGAAAREVLSLYSCLASSTHMRSAAA